MNENQKIILTLLLFVISYINFFVTSSTQQDLDLAKEFVSQGRPIENNLDFDISPAPILPTDTPFEHNHQCSCDQDVLVQNDKIDTCNCETRTEKNCACETCTGQSNPCKNVSDRSHRLQ